MPTVFVDSVAWIALLNTSDALHAAARQVLAELRQQGTQLLTTEFVLLEVADALSAPVVRERTVRFIDSLRKQPVRIIPASEAVLARGWSLYSHRADKEWSLTDCISFATMTDERITDAFTSDHHFEQAGFRRLLRDKP